MTMDEPMVIPDNIERMVAMSAAAAIARKYDLPEAEEMELAAAEMMAEIDPLYAAIIE